MTVETRLGSAGDANLTTASVAGSGAWQALTVTWQPTADRTAVAFAARRHAAAAAVLFYLDDVTVWDDSSIGTNPHGKDSNDPTETAYDADGRIVRSIIIGGIPGDPSLVTSTTYDSVGRVTAIVVNEITGAGTGDSVTNLTTSTAYDALGRVTDSWDPDNVRTVHVYDRLGRTTATTLNYVDGTSSGPTGADDVRSTFAYDATGGLVGYCPAVQVVAGCIATSGSDAKAWHDAFDTMGRMVSQTPPVNSTVTPLDVTVWAYEGGGRLASVTDQTAAGAIGRHTDHTYDRMGRVLTSKVYAGSGTGSPRQTTTRTWTIDGTPASVAFDGTGDSLGTPPTVSYVYDALGRLDLVKKGTTTMTDFAYNPDGTLSGRIDTNPVSTGTTYSTAFATYDWARRPTAITSASVFTGSATTSYRLDGLLAARTTPNGETISLAYDPARRPTTATLANGSTISQTYDRVGNVRTEARALAGVSGDNGTGTNTLAYDPLRRLVSETGLASARSYGYDLDGNRTRKVQGSTTIDYLYDATDQLTSQTIAGVGTTYSYNAYGDLTQSGTSVSTVTSYAYDTASHLVATNGPGGTGDDASFTLDALGRFATRRVAGALDSTYGYTGDSETVVALVGSTSTRLSAIGPDGSRLATRDGSTTAYLLSDLHGDVAGAEASGSTTIVNAIRYDGYGQTLGTPYSASGITLDTKYQGRLDVSASAEPLYDMSARFYSPAQGVFTGLDSVMGSALDPLSMNRFLYAEANPSTFIDPTGHFVSEFDSTPASRCTHIGDPGCGKTAPTSKATVRAATTRLAGNDQWGALTLGKKADDTISITMPGATWAPVSGSLTDRTSASIGPPPAWPSPPPAMKPGFQVDWGATALVVGLGVLAGTACVFGGCEALGIGAVGATFVQSVPATRISPLTKPQLSRTCNH